MFIQRAEYIEGYQIRVYFNDGTIRTIDLYHFLSKSKNHFVRKFKNIELFKQFRVEDGTICWGDNEFDINPTKIYMGEYDFQNSYQKKQTATHNQDFVQEIQKSRESKGKVIKPENLWS